MLLLRRGPVPHGFLLPWPLGGRRPAGASGAALATVAMPALAADTGTTGLGPWLFFCLALLMVGLGAYALGHLRASQRWSGAVRRGEAENRVLADLLDAWHWRTDAAHRLQRLQPPADAVQPPCPAIGGPIWSHWTMADPADSAGLRARLESHAAFAGLRVLESGSQLTWTLRAEPLFDDEGRFAGYIGTARSTAQDDAMVALQAVLDQWPGPALITAAAGVGGWAVQMVNTAACQLPGADARAALPNWPALQPGLPAELLPAMAAAVGVPQHPTGVAVTLPGGWQVRRLDPPGHAAAGRLLLVQSTPVPEAEHSAAGESESFVYTVSHDLRAPIRVVDGFTRILKEDYGRQFDRVGNDHLDRVLAAAARMNHMVDALLALARLSSLPLARQPVDLSQLASFIIEDLRRSAPERAADISIEPGMQVTGDPTLLRLVLENLLGNAWKYSAKAASTRIVFVTEQQDGRRVFVVRDNGAGFDMRSADRLFGLFQRLHSANDFPGTGVGLASVQRIVRRHGGEIWADAEPGRGAAFHFTLRG